MKNLKFGLFMCFIWLYYFIKATCDTHTNASILILASYEILYRILQIEHRVNSTRVEQHHHFLDFF